MTAESTSPKGMCIQMFRKLIEKVSEARKYGTDLLSMDLPGCCRETRL